MGGLPRLLADGLVAFAKHSLVGMPEVAVGVGRTVGFGDARPKLAAAGRAPVAREPGHHLACAAAERDPDPAGVGLAPHERPQLVQFQHVFRQGRRQCGFQVRQA